MTDARVSRRRASTTVVMNSIARSVVEAQKGRHKDNVFSYKGQPVTRIRTAAWKRARDKVALPQVTPHNCKHTFGYRLRQAGVSFEDCQDLLGHKNARITAHYCAADIDRLLEAAEKVTNDLVQSGYRPLLLTGTQGRK